MGMGLFSFTSKLAEMREKRRTSAPKKGRSVVWSEGDTKGGGRRPWTRKGREGILAWLFVAHVPKTDRTGGSRIS